jgi:DNA-binding NarL/FixJ family response regulator
MPGVVAHCHHHPIQEFAMPFETATRIQVLVMYAEPLMACGLAATLRSCDDFDVQQSDADGRAAGHTQRYDVVVCDYDTGLGLAAVGRGHPAPRPWGDARTLVMTAQDREQAVRLALERGVHGYMLLGSGIDEFVQGVRTLASGRRFLSLAVAQCMADSLTHEALTARESEVLGLLACGQCNKEIARDLAIAVGTVKAHVKAIMGKLEASSRTQAVSVATQRGLVEIPALAAMPQRAAPAAAPRLMMA